LANLDLTPRSGAGPSATIPTAYAVGYYLSLLSKTGFPSVEKEKPSYN
jgi:hypothetical protein